MARVIAEADKPPTTIIPCMIEFPIPANGPIKEALTVTGTFSPHPDLFLELGHNPVYELPGLRFVL